VFDTFPKDPNFPFRIKDLCVYERFNKKRMAWVPLRGCRTANGYQVVSWTDGDGNQKYRKLHRIIWMMFNGEIPEGLDIDHIDGNRENNVITNLRMVSHAYNLRLARARLGNWSPRILKPHHIFLIVRLPSNANWKWLAARWGVSKGYLLNLRCNHRKVDY
jgi:hypothetical protein